MADVTLSYKGSDILELSDSGSATLKTGGKYCEGDIDVEYVKPSGGGGVDVFTGEIELIDTVVGNSPELIVPVDVRNYNNFRATLVAVQTGLVSDGNVTLYDQLEIPSVFVWGSNKAFVPKYDVNIPEPEMTIKRDDTNLSSINNLGNSRYLYGEYSRNLTQISLTRTIESIAKADGMYFGTANGTRFFCIEGAYVKFAYKVEAW